MQNTNTIFEWSLSSGFKFSARKQMHVFLKENDTVSPKLQAWNSTPSLCYKIKILELQLTQINLEDPHTRTNMECKKNNLNVLNASQQQLGC